MAVIRHLKHWSPVVAYLSLLLGVVVALRSCQIDKRAVESKYLADAQAYKPALVPLDSLSLAEVSLPIDAPESVRVVNGLPEVGCHIEVKGELRFYNTGNASARIAGRATRDALTGRPVLRESLANEDRRNKLLTSPYMGFFRDVEVQPGGIIELPVESSICDLDPDSGACLHVIVLYQNPSGALYDTYYWVRLKVNTYEGSSENIPLPIDATHVPEEIKPDMCELVGHNVSTWIYGKKERDEIVDWLLKNSEGGQI